MRRGSRTRSMSPWTWWCTGSTSGYARGSGGSWGCCQRRDKRMDRPTTKVADQTAAMVAAASRPRSQVQAEATRRIRSILTGIGGYLPETVATNDELAKTVDTSDAWIYERTGIRQRHIAQKHETCAYMAAAAARAALADAAVAPGEVDAIILATATPDQAFPATALRVQADLGAQGFGFDLSAACSGFVYALSVADAMIRVGQARNALVIGAEVYSRILDW